MEDLREYEAREPTDDGVHGISTSAQISHPSPEGSANSAEEVNPSRLSAAIVTRYPPFP